MLRHLSPVRSRSQIATGIPCSARAAARLEPIKPAPPVTSIILAESPKSDARALYIGIKSIRASRETTPTRVRLPRSRATGFSKCWPVASLSHALSRPGAQPRSMDTRAAIECNHAHYRPRQCGTQMRCALAAAMLCCFCTALARADTVWPATDGLYTANNFRFGTGEILPRLRLHYLTLGTPHLDANGHTDNASCPAAAWHRWRCAFLAQPGLRRCAFRTRAAAGYS